MVASALIATSWLRPSVVPGIAALRRKDLKLVSLPARRKVGDSLDLDAATRQRYPNDNRWDYLLSIPSSAKIIALEPHSADDAEVAVVIAKRASALLHLREHFRPGQGVSEWLWVASGSVQFSRMDRTVRRLSQNGIRFVGRLLSDL